MKTLLKNCHIYDAETADILVEDGMIIGIGNFEEADEIRDMSDYAAVLPGIIDAHMHYITGEVPYTDHFLKKWAKAGVTTLRDLGVGDDMEKHNTADFIAFRDSVKEDPMCAQLLTGGRFVSTEGGYGHHMGDGQTGYGCKDAAACRAAVDELVEMGCDGIKTALDTGGGMGPDKPLLTPDQLQAIADEAKKKKVWCTAHILAADLVPLLLDAGIDAMAHMPVDPIADEVIERMVAQKVTVIPTLYTIDKPRPPLPPGVTLPPPPPGFVEPDTKQQQADCIDNTRRFVEKGGVVALGTDAMRMEVLPQEASMPVEEMRLMYQAGLDVSGVIRAATAGGALVLGIADQVGSIEVGKRANIIAVKDEIDESFEALSHVEFVMNKGVVISEK